MACGVQIRARLVDRSVDDEACTIHHCIGAPDPIAFAVDVHHVRNCQYTEVDSIWVYPKGLGLDGIWENVSNFLDLLSCCSSISLHPVD